MYHLIEASNLLLLGYIVGQMFRGVGAWSFRILEHEGGVIAHGAHQLER